MPRPKFDLSAPADTSPTSVTDWLEANLLIYEHKGFSRTLIRDRIGNAGLSEEPDILVDLVFAEVSRRATWAPATYPFRESDFGLEKAEGIDESAYEFLLWLAMSPAYRKHKRYARADYIFDHLVRQAIEGLLGDRATAMRFAWPSDGGRPKGFPQAMAWLARQLGLALGTLGPRPTVKDGGVDVIGWKPFMDRRTGFPLMLCQATVQDDLHKKARDIVVDQWRGWLAMAKDPVTVLAVPFSLPINYEGWDQLRYTVHIVMDRLRVCEFLPTRIAQIAQIRKWNAFERSYLVPFIY